MPGIHLALGLVSLGRGWYISTMLFVKILEKFRGVNSAKADVQNNLWLNL